MTRCGCAGACNCVLTAGAGITVDGKGTAEIPWVVGAGCNCRIDAGAGIVVEGNGTTATPFVISAAMASCDHIMDCVGANVGVGLTFNEINRQLMADVSHDPYNAIGLGNDGGLFVALNGDPGSAAIMTDDTPEIDHTGSGIVSDHLRSRLTGVRNGDWRVVGGSVLIGDGNSSLTQSFLASRQVVAGKQTQAEFDVSGNAGGSAQVAINENGIRKASLSLSADAHLTVYDSVLQGRPIPFATWNFPGHATSTNQAYANTTVTYPSGRFTVGPYIQATMTGTYGSLFQIALHSGTTTSCIIQVRLFDNQPDPSIIASFHLYAIQMGATAAASSAPLPPIFETRKPADIDDDDDPVVPFRSQCPTLDCPASQSVIEGLTTISSTVYCGDCGEDITSTVDKG